MANGFKMELRSQQEWSWLLAIDLFLGGLGGGLFLLFLAFRLPPFIGLVSLGLVILGGIVLLLELGHPLRAWRAIARPQTSWISRGVLFVSVFILSAGLYIAPALVANSGSGENLGAPWLGYLASLCALFITLYPGFVLSASRSIPFWDTALLPVLFFTHSVMGASGIILLSSRFRFFDGLRQIETLAITLMLVNIVLISIYLLAKARAGAAARESVRLLNRASLGWTFRIGVLLVGLVVPLLMVAGVPSTAPLAGVLILAGGLLFRYCMLKAGVYVPSALVGLDMSKLNRTDSDLAKEYSEMAARSR